MTADGTTLEQTADLDPDFTARTMHLWTIFIDDGADTAYFYLDGVLKGTESTNTLLNNSGDISWNFSVGGTNTDFTIGEFIISYEI